jgi:hypothetical protein
MLLLSKKKVSKIPFLNPSEAVAAFCEKHVSLSRILLHRQMWHPMFSQLSKTVELITIIIASDAKNVLRKHLCTM